MPPVHPFAIGLPVGRAPERHTNDDGSRFYPWEDPDTGDIRNFWSVTTALQAKNKPALKFWAANKSSQRAMDNIAMMLAAQRIDPCGAWSEEKTQRCGACPPCVYEWLRLYHVGETARRAVEGSTLHDVFEVWIKFNRWMSAEEAASFRADQYRGSEPLAVVMEPYIANLQRLVADYAIEPGDFKASEMTVYNVDHEYAGTLDGILNLTARNKNSAKLYARITGVTPSRGDACLTVTDLKTSERQEKAVYEEHSLQLTPYRHATHCRPVRESPNLYPMPHTVAGLVMQVHPDRYTFEPVLTTSEELRTFLNYLAAYRWDVERGKMAIAVKTFPVPAGFAWVEPDPESAAGPVAAKVAAPRKRAAKKAAPAPAATASRNPGNVLAYLKGETDTLDLGDGDPPF